MSDRPISVTLPDDGRIIRGLVRDGDGPTIVWLGGFRSDQRINESVVFLPGHRTVQVVLSPPVPAELKHF